MHLKTSFDPLIPPNPRVLILGSIPGDRSIALNEYYGHPQNRFWRTIANISNQPTPTDYTAKKAMLAANGIALWDVAHKAIRKGSMDSAIRNEEPNEINRLITDHPDIKIVAFNGKKAEELYNRYFNRLPGIEYVLLPSTSPANAAVNLEQLCDRWLVIGPQDKKVD